MSDVDKLCNQLDKIYGAMKSGTTIKPAVQFVRSAAVLRASKTTGFLAEHIFAGVESGESEVTGSVFTQGASYAGFVEMGTGPRGASDHDGISPEVTPAYRMDPWWIHESQIDPGTAEMYHWLYIDTPDGRFYKISGQPAQPFLYPALKNNEKEILDIITKEANKTLKGAL